MQQLRQSAFWRRTTNAYHSAYLDGQSFVLLLDEPSEGVAPIIVERMAKVIIQLESEGLTILLSEQNLHFAQLVADCAVIIESGKQKYYGILDELNCQPELRNAYLVA